MSGSGSEGARRSFEQALNELEGRVRRLDSGELPLEESLRLFEEGVALVRECQELLDGAERRIVELSASPPAPGSGEPGRVVEKPLP